MRKHNAFLVVGLLCLLMGLPCSSVLARDRNDYNRGRNDGPRQKVVFVNHNGYNHRDTKFRAPGWFGLEFIFNTPSVGTRVSFLPYGYKTRVSRGVTYYYYNNVYYQSCPGGYAIVTAPMPDLVYNYGGQVVINVPMDNGGYKPVTLIKQNNGYIGPQGEYYNGNPTVRQLSVLYGR
ncbi:MAG: hypothetical protein WCY05_03930 [Candidatus Omnitrophota bacterium]